MKAYKHLVAYALHSGYVISVWDGEEWQVKRSNKRREIIGAIESVEEAELTVYNTEGKKMGWAWVSPYGLADDETVMDYTMTEFMEEWQKQFDIAYY